MKIVCAWCGWILLGSLSLNVAAQSSEEAPAVPADHAPASEASESPPPSADEAAQPPSPPAPEASGAPATEPALIPVPGAAEAPAAVATRDTPAGSQRLDDVVVTVTKRAQASRDIPSSMTVLGGEKLEKLGYRKLKELFTLVPGINMQDEIGGLQRKVSVRGVGPDTGTNQTVGSVMGDIPISDPYGATTIVDPNPWDMRTVEILKGPQGTLFGATSLAGLIRYVPNYPELQRWEGKAFYDYTTVDRGGTAPSYGAALNMPVGDTIALRASGIYQHLPGVIDSDNPSRKAQDVDSGVSWGGRVMALWQPLERLTINAWYTKDRRAADDINIVTFADGSYARKDAPRASPSANGYSLGTLDMRYVFDWATLVSLSGYQQKNSYNDIDTSYLLQPVAKAGISFLRAERRVKTHGVLQELRLMSPDGGPLTWLGGIYYSTYSESIKGHLYIPNTEVLNQIAALVPISVPVLSSLISEFGLTASTSGFDPLDANEQALYGEANYDFTERFRLTLGSRVYKTKVAGTLVSGGAAAPNNGATPGSTEKGWSPKVAVTWKPWTDVMFYGNASRGFQFGGFNLPTISSPNIPLTFKSSSLWNYEAGVRTDWFERTLRFDLTAFFLDWKNPQVRQLDNTGLNLYVDNVGGTHNIGVETTIRWLTPLDGLIIEEAASYIEARTSEPFQDASGTEVPSGTLMPSSPLVQSVTTLTYSLPIGAWMTQAMLINSLQGKAWNNITHTVSAGDFDLLGLTFNVTRSDLPLAPSLTLSINNITNVQKVVAGFGPAPGVQQQAMNIVANSSYVYTQPRSIVLRASVEF